MAMPAWLSSVRVRVAMAAVIAVAIAFPFMRWALMAQVHRALQSEVQLRVISEVHRTAQKLQPSTFQAVNATWVDSSPEVAVEIVDGEGRVLARSSELRSQQPVSTLVPATGRLSQLVVHSTIRGDQGSEPAVAFSTVAYGQKITIYGVAFLGQVNRSVSLFGSSLLFLYPFLLLLVGLVAYIICGRALRPVETVRAELEEISASDLHRRLAELPSGDEIAGLVLTMNGMLDRIDHSITRQRQFVSDASHELRSPIAAILAQSQVAKAHPDRAELPVFATIVEREGIRMGDLVDDLLLLAKSDEGGLRHARGDVDLDEILLDEVQRLRAEGKLKVDAHAIEGLRITADGELLSRAIRNLVDNAARHAHQSVTLSCTKQGNAAIVIVADDGDGVDPSMREELFERFARGDASRSRSTGGSGLGLPIAREIASMHGGSLQLGESEQGASFVLRLPLSAE